MMASATVMQSIANQVPTTAIRSIERKVVTIARTRSRNLPPSPITAAEAFQECVTIILSKPSRNLIQLLRPLRDAFVAQVAFSGAAGAEALLNHLFAGGPPVITPTMIDLPAVSQSGGQLIAFLSGIAFNVIRDSSKKERRHERIILANDKLVLVYGDQHSARRIVRTSTTSDDPETTGGKKSRDYGARDSKLDAVGTPDRDQLIQHILDAAGVETGRIGARYGVQVAQAFRDLCVDHFIDGTSKNKAVKKLSEAGYDQLISRMTLYRALDRVDEKIKEQKS